MKTKITIKDVAKRAGVAISTVSKAINNREGLVSPETRTRIVKIAKERNLTIILAFLEMGFQICKMKIFVLWFFS